MGRNFIIAVTGMALILTSSLRAGTSGQICDTHLQAIARMVPEDQLRNVQYNNGVRGLLYELRDQLLAEAREASSPDKAAKKGHEPTAFVNTFDGHRLRYDLTVNQKRAIPLSPEEYERLL